MAVGAGKYDELLTEARTKAGAIGGVLLIFQGEKGWGMSCQASPAVMVTLPKALRHLAQMIERDLPADLKKIVESN